MKTWLVIGALNGFLCVGIGAFGAHALKARLPADLLAIFHTGAQYHFYHALAILAAALAMQAMPQAESSLKWAAVLFLGGILIFSGSLYVLAITGIRWLGAITPIGGLAFMIGWLLFAYAAFRG